MTWLPNSWQNFTIKHIPLYENNTEEVKNLLKQKEAILAFDEIIDFKRVLSETFLNKYFIVQMGECAETFEQSNKTSIISRLELLNNFSNSISNTSKVIKIGRIAGQYAKPRNEEFELLNGKKTPVYKGDMFHDFNTRELDARRMLEAYNSSLLTYKIIQKEAANIFISHEALNLHYEESLTREQHGAFYNLSAHMLWLGEKTRFSGSAHIEYLSGIENPIGIKISHHISSKDLIELINRLNPNNELGKIVLINRMGASNISRNFEELLLSIKDCHMNVLWICDPMHGNTFKTTHNYKTRTLTDIENEITSFANILYRNQEDFSGIHLESSSEDIYECIATKKDEHLLGEKYKTLCDPRLNQDQCSDIAKKINQLLLK